MKDSASQLTLSLVPISPSLRCETREDLVEDDSLRSFGMVLACIRLSLFLFRFFVCVVRASYLIFLVALLSPLPLPLRCSRGARSWCHGRPRRRG